MVDRAQLDNAVIFIRAVIGDFQLWNLMRNPPDFSWKVLYVQGLDCPNHPLIGQYPRRKLFLLRIRPDKVPPFYGCSLLTKQSGPAAHRSGGHTHDGEARGGRHPRLQ
jgi:hypothetical protein